MPDIFSRADRKIHVWKSLPFFGMHLACITAFLTGVSWKAIALCFGLYWLRMFAITAGYHRYFAHKTFQTTRIFQFIIAYIGCSAVQKGPLWWASHHRRHHQFSDQDQDVHSPERLGFWWSHVGWIICDKFNHTDFGIIKDFAKFRELRWLNRYYMIPGVLLALICFYLGGWQGLVWGFFISTVILYHSTFVINSLCHLFGRRRYPTEDTSRNSLILALLTMGEGWHNNHHWYATSARQGFRWWEVDISYYLLWVLSRFHVVWGLKPVPQHVLSYK